MATSKPQDHVVPVAWITLVIAAAISLPIAVWHALDAGAHPLVAVLYGLGPVTIAALQSHNVAAQHGGPFKRILTYAVLGIAMLLNLRAQADAVTLAAGKLHIPLAGVTLHLRWMFPLMLDLSAFTALHTIMSAGRSPRRVERKPIDRLTEVVQPRSAKADPNQARPISTTADRSAPKPTAGKRGRSIEELRVELGEAIEIGKVDRDDPKAEHIRTALRIAPDKARQLRDELSAGQITAVNGTAK